MVPAMTMLTSAAEPRVRGSFLSIIASVQQLGAGLAPLVTALFLSDEGPGSPLVGYPVAGALTAVVGLSTLLVAGLVRPAGERVVVVQEEAA
jgi:hypothetical protein